MKTIGKWLYILGLLVAALAGLLGFSASWLSILLVLVGILAGVFYKETDDLVNTGIRYLVLGAVYGVLDALPAVGPYLTGLFGGIFAFLGPVVLTTLVMWFLKKYLFGRK